MLNDREEIWVKNQSKKPVPVIATLRDQFAMAALTGLVNRLSPSIENDASEAYRIADAMLKVRIKEDQV